MVKEGLWELIMTMISLRLFLFHVQNVLVNIHKFAILPHLFCFVSSRICTNDLSIKLSLCKISLNFISRRQTQRPLSLPSAYPIVRSLIRFVCVRIVVVKSTLSLVALPHARSTAPWLWKVSPNSLRKSLFKFAAENIFRLFVVQRAMTLHFSLLKFSNVLVSVVKL